MRLNKSSIIHATMADLRAELKRQQKINKFVKGLIQPFIERRDGRLEIPEMSFNGVTTLGYNYMLDATFRNGAATLYPNWYIGLISNASYTSGLAVGDIMTSHSGWTEDSTHYTGSNRPQWSPAAASAKAISNASSVNFPINNDNTIIKGIFVCSDNTLGGTSGFLWSTGLFSSDQTLYNGDTLKITYVVNLN